MAVKPSVRSAAKTSSRRSGRGFTHDQLLLHWQHAMTFPSGQTRYSISAPPVIIDIYVNWLDTTTVSLSSAAALLVGNSCCTGDAGKQVTLIFLILVMAVAFFRRFEHLPQRLLPAKGVEVMTGTAATNITGSQD